jgi:NNP family nitrate/nitrite transporter-like MFS transporter
MLPLYLIAEHGYARETANALISVARISGLFMTLAAGVATDRLGAKTTLCLYFTTCAALTALYGLASGPLLLATIFLQSAVATCFFAPGFTVLSRAFAGPSQNVATSVIGLCSAVIGQGMVPAMLGAAGSAGHFGVGFLILGGLLLVCLSLLRWLPG